MVKTHFIMDFYRIFVFVKVKNARIFGGKWGWRCLFLMYSPERCVSGAPAFSGMVQYRYK